MAGAHFTIDTSGLRQIQERVQVMAFQSTPAIADGRIGTAAAAPAFLQPNPIRRVTRNRPQLAKHASA